MEPDEFIGYKLIALAVLIIVGLMGFAMLNGLQVGAAPGWKTAGYSLLVLSLATGGWAGFQTGKGRPGLPMFLLGLLVQTVGALAVVAMTMGGGATAWSVGFWTVSAVGWVPAYIWFFFITWVLHLIYFKNPEE